MNTPDSSGCSQRTQRGMPSSARAGFETRNETQRGSIDSPSANASRSATVPGARRSPPISGAQLALDDELREVLVGQRACPRRGARPAARRSATGRGRRRSGRTARGRRRGGARRPGASRRPGPRTGRRSPAATQLARERRVQRPAPQPGLVHHAEAVGEPRVLGRREDPAGALELADPAQPLDPRRVEQVLLGGRSSAGSPAAADSAGGQALRQLDVAVDRVADQVDRDERVARHQPAAPAA